MAYPKKTEENKLKRNLQVCLRQAVTDALGDYAQEEHKGNQSAAARHVVEEFLTDYGYLKKEDS